MPSGTRVPLGGGGRRASAEAAVAAEHRAGRGGAARPMSNTSALLVAALADGGVDLHAHLVVHSASKAANGSPVLSSPAHTHP